MHGQQNIKNSLTLMMKAIGSFETPGTLTPSTQHLTPQRLNFQTKVLLLGKSAHINRYSIES